MTQPGNYLSATSSAARPQDDEESPGNVSEAETIVIDPTDTDEARQSPRRSMREDSEDKENIPPKSYYAESTQYDGPVVPTVEDAERYSDYSPGSDEELSLDNTDSEQTPQSGDEETADEGEVSDGEGEQKEEPGLDSQSSQLKRTYKDRGSHSDGETEGRSKMARDA